ncbi:alpha/beta hydrolase [Stagnihabitans tardus]|uniref:Palmitoyl-protein thioesterase ABHD10, mitochondrial n=1 Tax=Stagnihabitans tardus TaxID=2699202 RepID=A0AAE4YBA4_9RHOB|nr:alpha/beta hydrolase [Stagnihabitans tardus]NBZ89428.1 alpha/beta fold hydrolase [Stagnihabitans tardus]
MIHNGRRIAHHQTAGQGPGVIFLGGYRSDMTGTKALALQAWAEARGRAFLRFDYSGHGASEGVFETLGISDWLSDAKAALSLTEGPQILVGSSMGGWLSLLLAREVPDRVKALVLIAPAPDFTHDSLLPSLTQAEREALGTTGVIHRPSAYADFPYIFSRALISQGAENLVLRAPLALPPTRILHGTADVDVPQDVPLRLLAHATGDLRLTLVKDADHRFSSPDCLGLIESTVDSMS